MDEIHKAPFLRLILPLLAGILGQYYLAIQTWSIVPLLIGLGMMLLSNFLPSSKQYHLRWMFGGGLFFFIFAIGVSSTYIRQKISEFTFPDIHASYHAAIIDIPQDKPNSIAYKVELKNINKKIVCYLPKENAVQRMSVGDNFIFFAKIEPFKSLRNSQQFDYSKYMYNKGYAGYTYITPDKWEKTDNIADGILIRSAKCRMRILDAYKVLDLTTHQQAILSALTLGYTDDLSNDIVQSFRATGTAHILSVSGMHVAIFYIIILTSLSFIPQYSKYRFIKPVVIILLLCIYAFIIGLPPSAVRACLMLSTYSISQLRKAETYSYNTLFATAFLMLIWNPLQLFDIGFQLSFAAVLSMMLLIPVFSKIHKIKNKYSKYFLDIFFVSLAAQVGTFPLCLYYFGTFPTYFFITNMLIAPIISLIIYNTILIILSGTLGVFFPQISSLIQYIPLSIHKILVTSLTYITQFFEKLPYAQIKNIQISSLSLFLIWITTGSFLLFITRRSPKALICTLCCILLTLTSTIYRLVENKNSLIIYNKPQANQLILHEGYAQKDLSDLTDNQLLSLQGKRYMIVTDDCWKEKLSTQKWDIDYLHITGSNSVSLYSLSDKFNIKKIILGSLLSSNTLKRLIMECEKLRIPYYDISEKGELRIFF